MLAALRGEAPAPGDNVALLAPHVGSGRRGFHSPALRTTAPSVLEAMMAAAGPGRRRR